MATLDQYSEAVAAYGYTLPPPPKAQVNRLGLALLYAAIGTALGTMTGTGMAVVSMQPGGAAAWAHHLSLPNLTGATKTAHAPSAPQVAHAKSAPVVSHAPAPVVAHASTAAAPVQAASAPAISAHTVSAHAAPAAAVPALAVPAPVVHPSILARIVAPSVVEASVDAKAVQRELAVRHTATLAPVVHRQNAIAPLAGVQKQSAPAVNLYATNAPAVPVPAVVPVSLDEEVGPAAVFFSEGDAAVVDYDATLDTILTSDGRTFVLGPTVSMSSAASWNDYRDNVHYRCDQGGKCTLTRSGVVALNAKLI
jgi:hypothetical protein